MLDRICELTVQVQKARRKKGPGPVQRTPLVEGLKAIMPALKQIAADGETMGLDANVLAHLRPDILARAQELAALN